MGGIVVSGNRTVQNTRQIVNHGSGSYNGVGDERLTLNLGTTFTNQGTFTLKGNTDITGDGRFDNQGTLIKQAGATGDGITRIANLGSTGTPTFGNSGMVEVQSGKLEIGNRFDNVSGTTLSGGTYIIQGIFQSNESQRINTIDATVILDGPAAQFLGEFGSQALVDLATIGLSGEFQIRNDHDFSTTGDLLNQGRITLGSESTLDVAGQYTQDAAGTLSIGIAGTPASGQFGNLTTPNPVALDGTFDIALADGFVPAFADGYEVMAFPSRIGDSQFASFTGLEVDGEPFFEVATNSTNVVINGVFSQNSPPIVAITGIQPQYFEGDTVSLGSTVTDAAPGDTHTYNWTVDYAVIDPVLGTLNEQLTGVGSSISFSTIDNVPYVVTLTVSDGTNSVSVTETILPADVPPTVTIDGAAAVDEGAMYTLNLSFNDPGLDPILQWTIDWGDGTIELLPGISTEVSHVYADGTADYTITAQAENKDAVSEAVSRTVTVLNVAPTVAIVGDATVDEEAPYTLNLAASDPGDDTITSWTIDWGDGAVETIFGNLPTAAHTYTDGDADFTINATATDEDGTHAANSLNVSVLNVAPTLSVSGATTVDEGAPYTLNLASSNLGEDPITSWTVNWGTGFDEVILGNPSTLTNVYHDGPDVFIVTASATDSDGNIHQANEHTVLVLDVPPALSVAGPNAVLEGLPITLELDAVEPGNDVFDRWTIDWGDGTIDTNTDRQASVTHTYLDGDESYEVVISASDDDGSQTITHDVQVVNQPPEVAIGGEPAVNEGATYTLDLFSSDPGDDTIGSWTIDWGDGNVETIPGNPSSATHVFVEGNIDRTITARANDGDGVWNANSVAVTVHFTADDAAVTDEDTPIVIGVLANDVVTSDGTIRQFQKISDTVGSPEDFSLDNMDLFGGSLAVLSDLDGDGINELVVGAVRDDDGGTGRGALYVLFMNADGTARAVQKISDTAGTPESFSLENNDLFGDSVADVGDLNGDGIADLAVGASGDDDGGTQRGAVYVLLMNADGTVQEFSKISDTVGTPDSFVLGDFDEFGGSVAALGPPDANGVFKIAVGAAGDDDGGLQSGAAYLMSLVYDPGNGAQVTSFQKLSGSTGMPPGFSLSGFDGFGRSPTTIGDLDGDGIDELAVGAFTDGAGAFYVLSFDTDGMVTGFQKISDTDGTPPAFALEPGDQFGIGLAPLGDFDGDGIPDLAVSADRVDGSGGVFTLFLNADGTVKDFQKLSDSEGTPA